jgi:hypothetical protein
MALSPNQFAVYVESGKKRTFAGAIDWPGWCRSGRDESSALQALLDYGPRYAGALDTARLVFHAPGDLSALSVVERLVGNATTDFGAPAVPPASDERPLDRVELGRTQALLEACWRAFDAAGQAASGKELRRGPRGGGRQLAAIVEHVLEADIAYLARLGWKIEPGTGGRDPEAEWRRVHQAVAQALAQAVDAEPPARGPRGGARWTARYFVRRHCWHVLDHAWEIEDRTT